MPPTEFEPTIQAIERPQTYVLEHTASRIGKLKNVTRIFILLHFRLTNLSQKHGFFHCATKNLSWHQYFALLALCTWSKFFGSSIAVFKVVEFTGCVTLLILN
jgi:hypothetical protein